MFPKTWTPKIAAIPTEALIYELKARGYLKTAHIRHTGMNGQLINFTVEDANHELAKWVVEKAIESRLDIPHGFYEAQITVLLNKPIFEPTSSISEPTENPDALHGHVGEEPKATGGLG